MLNVYNYGVPIELKKACEDIFTSQVQVLAEDIRKKAQKNPALVTPLADNSDFLKALGYLAWNNEAKIVIPILYEFNYADMPKINFDWLILGNISFSNAYFLVFFNELYSYNLLLSRRRLNQRGVILRNVAEFSFQSWDFFQIPISNRMKVDFFKGLLINS